MNPTPTEPKTEAEAHKQREDALEKFFATSLGTGGRHEAFRAGFDACMAIMAEAVINLTKMREDLERRAQPVSSSSSPEALLPCPFCDVSVSPIPTGVHHSYTGRCALDGLGFSIAAWNRRTPPPETNKQGRAISWWLAHYTNATCPELVAVNFAARLERERNAALSAIRATGGSGK